MRLLALCILLVVLGIVVSQPAQAQATCPDLVLNAVDTIGSNCSDIGRNSVCYGNTRIDAVLTRPLSVNFFNAPSDQIRLVDVQSLRTAPLDLELEEWGIAVMNVQANLPEVLPGQVVTLLVIGDADVRNDSPINTHNAPTITTNAAATLHSQPDANSSSINPLDANTSLLALGASPEGEWLRVAYDDLFGWVNRSVVNADVTSLPIVDADTPLPMQAFSFRAAIGGPRCAEAPPSVLVMQGPEQVRVNLTVNGARMQLGSTAALWQPIEAALQLAVLDGEVEFEDGTIVERGFTAAVTLDQDGQVGSAWTQPRPLTVFEIAALLPLESFPDTMLNYPINVPEEGEPTPTPHVTPTFTLQPTRFVPRPTLTPIPPSPVPEPIVSFTADSQVIGVGECTTLRWFTQNIDSVYFENQPTVGESSQQVCPQITSTYVLLVVFRDGTQQTYSLTIEVRGPTSAPVPVCGNQICEPGETIETCSVDCHSAAPVCGNQICEPGESMRSCPNDCTPVCGNQICEPGENSCNCNHDCPGTCIG